MSRIGGPLVLLACLASTPAGADTPITDRNYAIDLYEGAALGNSATIAMGGAAAANAIGSSGTLINPSAPAVRPTTDTDTWSWDYHLDYFNSTLSTDYDNNGTSNAGGAGTSALTLGVALRVHDWAGAITGTTLSAPVNAQLPTPAGPQDVAAETSRLQLAVARWVPAIDTAFGASFQLAQFSVKAPCTAPECDLFTIQGGGLEAGATWIPRLQNIRLGGAVAAPVSGTNPITTNCDPVDCGGYTLPGEVHVPWRVVAGGAYRWAETRWNQLVGGNFRDEPSVTAVADVVVTGPSPNAYGLEAFGQKELQRSGRHTAWSIRAGAEYEWLPGRLRVRAGTYWEPGRFIGVPGRLHGTFGIEVRWLEFHLWGRRRGRITLTTDFASQYRNGGVSIGFWH